MSPGVFLIALLSTLGIAAFTVITVTRLFTHRPKALSGEALERLDELEQALQGVQRELAETQERLDFAERLIATTREERRLGG